MCLKFVSAVTAVNSQIWQSCLISGLILKLWISEWQVVDCTQCFLYLC